MNPPAAAGGGAGAGVPAGPAPPHGAGAHTLPVQVATYADYFADANRDPHGGDYASLLTEFRTTGNPPGSATVYTMVGNMDPSYPQAFLHEYVEDGEVRYRVIQGLSKYPSLVGRPTPWDGKVYGFTGDVVSNQITTVEVPTDAFALSDAGGAYTNVPATVTRALELLAQEPGEPFVGPFPDGDANIKQVRSRKWVPLPHRYVRLLLDRQVSPREGFIDLVAAIQAHQDNASCEVLLDWLLLSITRNGPAQNPNLAGDPLSSPVADRALHRHRRAVLVNHLPGIASPVAAATGVEAAQRSLAASVSDMVNEQRLARAEAAARAAREVAPKTVSKALGAEVANTLKAVCMVDDEEHLPAVWRSLAAAGKRDRQALEHALQAKARDLQMAEAAPIATPDLVKKVTGLQWAGLNIDDLGEGIQPFSLVLPDYVGSDAGIAAQRLADTYDILTGSDISSSLKDAQSVKATKAVVPVDFGEARAHLVATMLTWTVLVGDTHPFVLALGRFVKAYTAREYSYQNKLRLLGTAEPPATLLLRYIQLRSVAYWRKAISYRQLPSSVPAFEDVLDKLDMQDRSWLPALPQKYWKPLVNPASDLKSVLSGITFGTSPPPGGSTSGSTGGSSGTASGSTSTGGGSAKKSQTQTKNPNVSAQLQTFQKNLKDITIKDAIAKGGEPPSVDRQGKSVPMCISYHLKGECWSGCSRREDHGPHTAEEDAKLLNWCQAAFA